MKIEEEEDKESSFKGALHWTKAIYSYRHSIGIAYWTSCPSANDLAFAFTFAQCKCTQHWNYLLFPVPLLLSYPPQFISNSNPLRIKSLSTFNLRLSHCQFSFQANLYLILKWSQCFYCNRLLSDSSVYISQYFYEMSCKIMYKYLWQWDCCSWWRWRWKVITQHELKSPVSSH